MPVLTEIPVKDLVIDLKNYRTMPQKNETGAIKAMITIKADKFWGIMESLLDSGYMRTENIIIQKNKDGDLIVKEGNRRIAALKIILGIAKLKNFDIPDDYVSKIEALSVEWKEGNSKVLGLIFECTKTDTIAVDKIVSITHGKGETASRDKWTSVARARHNRDINNAAEPALDVLESYLNTSPTISAIQKDLWAADFPLTVLHELMRHLTPILKLDKITDFATQYPSLPIPKKFSEIIHDIGAKKIGFDDIRKDLNNILTRLGIALPVIVTSQATSATAGSASSVTTTATGASKSARKAIAISNTDPRYIIQTLKKFQVRGNDREKVVALKDEAVRMKNIENYPYSFCFLFRSMLEISAKLYCKENGIPTTTIKAGKRNDKTLKELLGECRKFIVSSNPTDKELLKALHGAHTELAKPDGLLSVTSLNHLVHNPKFSTTGTNIASIFTNVSPLFEILNS